MLQDSGQCTASRGPLQETKKIRRKVGLCLLAALQAELAHTTEESSSRRFRRVSCLREGSFAARDPETDETRKAGVCPQANLWEAWGC